MTIGERIRFFRKKAGLTQKALGEKCKMPDSQIRQYELGMVNPKIEQLQRIATALNCDISELLAISDAMPKLKKEHRKKETANNLQEYLESIGYTVLREEITRTVKKGFTDFELSEDQKDMVNKYGYVMLYERPYYIQGDKDSYRLTENEFASMEGEILSVIEHQLWKHRIEKDPE